MDTLLTKTPIPDSLLGEKFKRVLWSGNPPHSPYVHGWVMKLGRLTSAVEKKWFKDNGFRFGRGAWGRPDDWDAHDDQATRVVGLAMAKRNPKRAARKQVDFDDEDAVGKEMAKELGVDRLAIRESHYADFGAGKIYLVESGHEEYYVAENEDQAEELALAMVKQDLENEPEIFNKSFLESHIDTGKLRDALYSDVYDMRFEDADQMRPGDFWDAYEAEGFTAPDEDEDGDRPDPTNAQIDELAESQAKAQLKDPMQWLEEIYGEEATGKAMEMVGFDIDAAAQEAVNVDGVGHFLSPYDGTLHDTPSGFVYWRHN